jgi:hypothetical protein
MAGVDWTVRGTLTSSGFTSATPEENTGKQAVNILLEKKAR